MKPRPGPKTITTIYFVGALGSFLIILALVLFVLRSTKPPGIDQARAAERLKNLKQLTAATTEQLDSYKMLDPTRHIVQLPINRAMAVTVKEWQNAGAGRSNLLQRLAAKNAKISYE